MSETFTEQTGVLQKQIVAELLVSLPALREALISTVPPYDEETYGMLIEL